MRHAPSTLAMIAAAALAATLAHPAPAAGNGSKGKKRIYSADVPRGQKGGLCRLSAEVEPILFQLTSVESKYRVVRIRLVNDSEVALPLSKQEDKLTVEAAGTPQSGILDLAAHDSTLWNRLDPKLRELLVYPASVPSGEEENVFVFLPVEAVTQAPDVIRYTIAGVGGSPILLAERRARAARLFD